LIKLTIIQYFNKYNQTAEITTAFIWCSQQTTKMSVCRNQNASTEQDMMGVKKKIFA